MKTPMPYRPSATRARPAVPWDWLVDDLCARPDCVERRLFGCHAFYLGEKIVAVFAAGEEPWNGILWPVPWESHAELRGAHTELRPHPVLGKWLYLPGESDTFEPLARALLARILRGDPLLGVVPQPRRARKFSRKAENQKPPSRKPQRGTGAAE